MAPVVVIGSGASGVHSALTLLELGREVILLDVGATGPEHSHPAASFSELRRQLPDPIEYLLGKDFESTILPSSDKEYYGFPPSKSYVFDANILKEYQARGFSPLASHAAGGLAQAVEPVGFVELVT